MMTGNELIEGFSDEILAQPSAFLDHHTTFELGCSSDGEFLRLGGFVSFEIGWVLLFFNG